MTQNKNINSLPVLDEWNKHALIIGYAESEGQASKILKESYIDCGNSEEELKELESNGFFNANLRYESIDNLMNLDDNEISNGFYSN